MRPQDMVVGRISLPTGSLQRRIHEGPKQVYWYQFKVPVRQPVEVVNGIQDFRSIRFMRLAVKGWVQPVTLRFARLEFIRGEWRKYQFSLEAPGEVPPGGDPDPTTFSVAAVNVEENGNRTPINYVLPPDINKEVDVSSANLRNLNEQSLQLKVCNLRDGDSRAAFRNVSFDIRSYKKLRMYIHAESSDPADPLEFGDASVFVRLGNDYDQNYYEYEIPLTPSDSTTGTHTVFGRKEQHDHRVRQMKDLRYNVIKEVCTEYPLCRNDGDRRVFVKGNPNLSQMSTIMIGVRNPQKNGDEENPWRTDDGLPQCMEVWVNELRLTDFDQSGGGAAIARVNAQLADLGSISVAGNYSTPFWGSIDKRVSERQRETKYGVDVSANLEWENSCRNPQASKCLCM